MVDWWTEDDGKEYEKRVEVMVGQANNFEVHGQAVKASNIRSIRVYLVFFEDGVSHISMPMK